MEVNVRIAGAAGQGVDTIGAFLTDTFAGMGIWVVSTQSYMSRIRGGLNWCDVRLADREVFAASNKADLLVALSDEAVDVLGEDLTEHGLILRQGAEREGTVSFDFAQAARDAGGTPIMANTVAAGAIFALLGYDLEPLLERLRRTFASKGPEVTDQNIACARRGVDLIAARSERIPSPPPSGAPTDAPSATDGVALGAATGGVKVYTAYPMTPSTGVLTYLAQAAEEFGIVVEQAEDEIAAMNMICGATYAGVPAMTGTSGGGFALMVEGLSLAGMLELPIVAMVGQRPGPATGLPTRTGQQELLFVIHAGAGEFPRAVYAPGTATEAYDLTRLALATAHEFQTPTLILTDQFMMDLRKNAPPLSRELRPVDRCLEESPSAAYVRYRLTENGVSPRAIPGGEAFVVVDSDEHTEDGRLTEDLEVRVRLQGKRMAKETGLRAQTVPPAWYGPEDAGLVLITWGSTYGPGREAIDLLNAEGPSAAMVHFSQVWPLDAEAIKARLGEGDRRLVCVEGNSTGQFGALLREVGVGVKCEPLLKYDGVQFTAAEIVEGVRR